MNPVVVALAVLPLVLAAARWLRRVAADRRSARLAKVARRDQALAHHPATRAQQTSLTIPPGWAPPRQRTPEEGE